MSIVVRRPQYIKNAYSRAESFSHWERFLKTTASLSNLIPPCFYYLTNLVSGSYPPVYTVATRYSGLHPKQGYRSTGRKKNVCRMYCTEYARRHTPATASSRQPQTTQTREPWRYQVDFGTTISNSFLGQISYLRRGNPLRASALVTH